MPIRLLNAVLLIAALIGGVFAYQACRKHQQLLAERERLEKQVGRLRIEDPSKMYVRALETGEELHFAWRVYFPAGFNLRAKNSNSGSTWVSKHAEPIEFIARVRFRERYDGLLNVFTKLAGSRRGPIGDRRLADLLRGRWDEVQVEQLGSDGQVAIDADEGATFLRLTLSDDLKREAGEKLSKSLATRFQRLLFDMHLGSDKAFQQATTGKPSAGE
jgi:hypothetical protein